MLVAPNLPPSPGSISRTPPLGLRVVSPLVGPTEKPVLGSAGCVLPPPKFRVGVYVRLQVIPSSVELISPGTSSPVAGALLNPTNSVFVTGSMSGDAWLCDRPFSAASSTGCIRILIGLHDAP